MAYVQLRRKWGCTPGSRPLGAQAPGFALVSGVAPWPAVPCRTAALPCMPSRPASRAEMEVWAHLCLLFRFQSETVRGLKC